MLVGSGVSGDGLGVGATDVGVSVTGRTTLVTDAGVEVGTEIGMQATITIIANTIILRLNFIFYFFPLM